MSACNCGVPVGQEAAWVHRRECEWQRSLVCCCPADDAGAQAADCPACRWTHLIGADGRGCPWVRADEARRERQWLCARDIVLGALAAAGVGVIVEGDGPRFHKMRMDLWAPLQQRQFGRDLAERLEVRPVAEELFGPHMTVDVAIGRVAEYLRKKGLVA